MVKSQDSQRPVSGMLLIIHYSSTKRQTGKQPLLTATAGAIVALLLTLSCRAGTDLK